MRAEGKHPYTKRTPTRCRGHSEERKSSNVLRRPTRSPPTPYYLPCRRICQAQSDANEPPHHKRVRTDGAEVFLDLREGARGLSKRGTLYEFAPFPLRGIFAMTTRRQPSARSAENPSAAWKPIYSPDRGKHPMRKTMTAVARDVAIWREHKRRQRSDEHDVIVAERKRGVSPSRAEKRLPARRYAHARRMKPRIEQQLEAGFFPSKRQSAPRFSALGPRKRAPAKGGARLCRESRATRASRRRWDQASR